MNIFEALDMASDFGKEIRSLKRQLVVERDRRQKLETKVKLFRQEIQILKDAMLRLEGYVE